MTNEISRTRIGKRLSQSAQFGGIIFLAGQVASNDVLTIEEQTSEILKKIDDLLLENGSDKSRILSCQIFLANMNDFEAMNTVWDDWVVAGHTPARATVSAALGSPGKLIEMVVVAAQNRPL